MAFILSGLPADLFRPFFGLTDRALAARGAVRFAAEPSFPCRITLEDAEPGEPVILLPFEHQPHGLYCATGPIFVRESAGRTKVTDAVPPSFRKRLYSARAYAADGMMIDAEVGEGVALEALLDGLFASEETAYVHLHHARRGCYACRVDRA
jgi:hypothetical protein